MGVPEQDETSSGFASVPLRARSRRATYSPIVHLPCCAMSMCIRSYPDDHSFKRSSLCRSSPFSSSDGALALTRRDSESESWYGPRRVGGRLIIIRCTSPPRGGPNSTTFPHTEPHTSVYSNMSTHPQVAQQPDSRRGGSSPLAQTRQGQGIRTGKHDACSVTPKNHGRT